MYQYICINPQCQHDGQDTAITTVCPRCSRATFVPRNEAYLYLGKRSDPQSLVLALRTFRERNSSTTEYNDRELPCCTLRLSHPNANLQRHYRSIQHIAAMYRVDERDMYSELHR